MKKRGKRALVYERCCIFAAFKFYYTRAILSPDAPRSGIFYALIAASSYMAVCQPRGTVVMAVPVLVYKT